MQVRTTKDQGLYNKPSTAVHPGALAAGTLPQYNTIHMTVTVCNTATGFLISNPKKDVREVEGSVRKNFHVVYNFVTKELNIVSREIVGDRLSPLSCIEAKSWWLQI